MANPNPLEHLAAFGLSIISMFLNPQAPLGRTILYGANRSNPNATPEAAILIDLFYRQQITADDFYKGMGNYGFGEAAATQMLSASAQLLQARDYITLWRRGEIDDAELEESLRGVRFSKEQIPNLKALTVFYPSPGDLIRFAVREVYSPEVAQKFGLYEDIPDDFIREGAKVGLRPETASQYWAAHWELPSAGQGFEMMQRRIIDQDTLKLLLRALDVMPFWRDKMIQLSYNPLTRVDVRRMYATGTLDKEGVYNSYLDVGYSPENAALMTDFTIKFESHETDGITRATVVSAYVDDIITRDQLQSYLTSLGFTKQVTNFWLDNADFQKTNDLIKELKDQITRRFRAGLVNLDKARDELNRMGLPAIYIERIIRDLTILQVEIEKLPSRQDLTDWLSNSIIVEDEYVEGMRKLGYGQRSIELYLSEIALGRDTSKRKYLQQAVYVRWLKKGILTEDAFASILGEQGVSEDDIQNLIMETKEG